MPSRMSTPVTGLVSLVVGLAGGEMRSVLGAGGVGGVVGKWGGWRGLVGVQGWPDGVVVECGLGG